MIRFGIGKVGTGKGIHLMSRLEKSLVKTNRVCVVNLAEIKLPELQERLFRLHKNRPDLDLNGRLQIIAKRDSHEFYRFRGDVTMPQLVTPEFSEWEKMATREQKDEKYEKYFLAEASRPNAHGVEYFLDEAHRFFKAEDWAKISGPMSFYWAQMRHLDDVLWLYTQFPEQVVVTLRRAAEDSFIMHNHYKESFMFWRKPGKIHFSHYYGVPESKEKNATLIDEGKLYVRPRKLPTDIPDLCDCYLTRGALGGKTDRPETIEKTSKLPFWTIWLFGAGAAITLTLILYWVPVGASAGLGKLIGAQGSTLKSTSGLSAPSIVDSRTEPAQSKPPVRPNDSGAVSYPSLAPQNAPQTPQTPPKEPPKVSGWLRRGTENILTFSDGTVYYNPRGGIRGKKYGLVEMVDGRVLVMEKPKTPEPAERKRGDLDLPGESAGASGELLDTTGKDFNKKPGPVPASQPKAPFPTGSMPGLAHP